VSADQSGRNGHVVVAIDGPAASGKSSTAQWVAKLLSFSHVDSGALYRAATAAMLRVGKSAEEWSEEEVLAAADSVTLLQSGPSFSPRIEGNDISEDVRSPEVTKHVSRVAQMPLVRTWVNEMVRSVASSHDVVVDGRDMGTTVFPDAELKVFLVADPWERARRRLVQRLSRHPTDEEIAEETERLVRRDSLDATQTLQAKDAVQIDTTFLTQQEQVERIVALARAVMQRGDPGAGQQDDAER
jgi:cytidylate kinase